ncbi:MAG: hypothetical protein FJZ01_22060, partial [Candidatus Sericytochromatia bacterium]|nr:hypothetical protein [Candidatus Tanganyikabacteria bacterium]
GYATPRPPKPAPVKTPPSGTPRPKPTPASSALDVQKKMAAVRQQAQTKVPIKTPPPKTIPTPRPMPTPPPRAVPTPRPGATQQPAGAITAVVTVSERQGTKLLLVKTIKQTVPPGTTTVQFATTGLRSGVTYEVATSLIGPDNRVISRTVQNLVLDPGTNRLVAQPSFKLFGADLTTNPTAPREFMASAGSTDNPFRAAFKVMPGGTYRVVAGSALPGCGPEYELSYGFTKPTDGTPNLTSSAVGTFRVAPLKPDTLFVQATRAGSSRTGASCVGATTVLTIEKIGAVNVIAR